MRKTACIRTAAIAALFLSAAAPLWALRATFRGPDAAGYTATDAAVYSFIDISGGSGGAGLLTGTDDGSAALTLPFPFTFYGQPYSIACVSSNGAIYFVGAAASCSGVNDFANVDLALTTANDWPALFPFWTDLTFQAPGAGSVLYQTLGAAGSRRFVLQWNNAYPVGSANAVTFQVVLSEGTNAILFQYKTVALGAGNPAASGAQATVGIRNTAGMASNQVLEWSFDAPVLRDNSALLFSAARTASLTVTGGAFMYDGHAHAATATATGVNGETLGPVSLTYNGDPSAPIAAGTYSVVALLAANGNYSAATATTSLSIAKTPLSATADSATRAFGAANPTLTGSLTGVAAGDPIVATFTTSANASSHPGAYPIVPTLADPSSRLGNYTVTLHDGTLTITKAAPAITWPAPADIVAGTPLGAAQLSATASVAGTFVYSPAAGTLLAVGANQTLTVTFTPANTTDYATATASVPIDVVAGQTGRLTGDGGIDTAATQTRFTFDVRTHPPREHGHLKLRTRASQGNDRDGDNDRDDRQGPWSRFESTAITEAGASNSPGVAPGARPKNGVDTLTFAGVGTWNGAPDYRFTAKAVDAGEPGRGRDQFSISIYAPNGALVASVAGTLTSGNIQSVAVR